MDINFVLLSFATALIVVMLVHWIYWRWNHRRMMKLSEMVPGPPCLPILGNALIFMSNPKEQLNIISQMLQKYGQYVRIWLGSDLNICVKNPHDIRLLLTSNKITQKGPVYEFLKIFIGPGLLAGGPTWRNHRKIATPAYNKKAVQYFSNVFNTESEDLIQVLRKRTPNVTFNIYDDILSCTTRCVCQTLMGLSKEDAQNVKHLNSLVEETPRMYSFLFKIMTRWWLRIPIVYWMTGARAREQHYKKRIAYMISDVIEKRRRAMRISEEEDMSAVDLFIKSGEMTDEEIKWETMTVFTTSQEASAKLASAVLLFLSHLPDWQDKVYEEIIAKLGFEDTAVTDDQVKKLEYLDMVYKEALRYLSIAALIQRTVTDEITINDGKITLPVGTSLVIPLHDLHRDPLYWDEPNKIKPERFLPENVKKRDPNAFIPFSLGPMDCLGRVYASSLIKTIVVRVLRNIKLVAAGPPPDELEIHVAISVKFANGYNLQVMPRDKISE